MIDLEAIRKRNEERHEYDDNEAHRTCAGDIDALIAEVERLIGVVRHTEEIALSLATRVREKSNG